MSNIFISYNRTSEAIVKTLADDIEALGHNPWFDQELSGGQAWWEQVLKQIRDCDVFILILSPESLDSVA
ncbi:MAG: toll/interleukin-1 receptor domain-containing protein [Proteobacteria bacterium]|nr:toll/interleukin-1 receptor domain-containing protein [Pseudomonadota bacterium]